MSARMPVKFRTSFLRRLTAAVSSARNHLAYLLFAVGLSLLLTVGAPFRALAISDYVGVVNIDGPIDDISARYLVRALDEATADGAQLAVIRLDTPGGLLSSTRDMVQAILSAQTPVAVYVSPPGARAGSAGTFITAAANFAVMAPSTNIGAASPVAAGGRDIPTTLAKKINEDTRAFIRSIAERRGRNTQALEETVTKARSYSASEAVGGNIVDFIAADLKDLLVQLDGRTAKTSAGPVVLHTRDANVREIEPTLLEGFLRVFANPDVAFVLLAIGGLGILVEMVTPGFIGPGVIGVISLSLAFVAIGNLPVNWIGVGLILFSMILLYLEMAAPGFGIFGIGGLICFALGGFLLFGDVFRTPDIPEPSFRVRLWVLGVTAGMVAVSLLFFVRATATAGGSQTGHISDSKKGLVGQRGVAVSDLTPSGNVRVVNEEWTATTESQSIIHKGEDIRVIGIYGNILKVTKYCTNDEGKDTK